MFRSRRGKRTHRGIAVHTRGLGCFCTKGKSVYTLCACSLNMTKSRNLFLVRFHCIDIVQFCILAAVFEWRMDVSSVCETWLDCDISRWKKCSFLVSHRSISLFVLLRVQLKATRMWFSNVRVSFCRTQNYCRLERLIQARCFRVFFGDCVRWLVCPCNFYKNYRTLSVKWSCPTRLLALVTRADTFSLASLKGSWRGLKKVVLCWYF